MIQARDCEVVILDPFISFFDGESTDKPEQVQRVTGCLDQLQYELGLRAVGFVHHGNVAGERPAGSWHFEAWPSTIIRLDQAKSEGTRVINFRKMRTPGASLPRLDVRLTDGRYEVVGASRASSAPPASPEDDAAAARERLTKEIRKCLRFSRGGRATRSQLLRKTRAMAEDLDAAIEATPDLVLERVNPFGTDNKSPVATTPRRPPKADRGRPPLPSH